MQVKDTKIVCLKSMMMIDEDSENLFGSFHLPAFRFNLSGFEIPFIVSVVLRGYVRRFEAKLRNPTLGIFYKSRQTLTVAYLGYFGAWSSSNIPPAFFLLPHFKFFLNLS